MDAGASGGHTFITTISGGIQDISALLPLLGTEQCEDHVASALTNGYLYAAVSPISLFGSLGVARAGFKAFVSTISIPLPSCFPWPRFEGAKLLSNAGFKPQGLNMPLIMLDEERKRYCAENRIHSMMEELHIEDSSRISVSSNIRGWNIKMFISTAFFCTLSILPYVYLNVLGSNTLNHFLRWAFPVLRAIGSFLAAAMIQLVMQRRLLTLTQRSLILKGLKKTDLERLGIDSWSTTNGEPAVNSKSAVDSKASQGLFPSPDQRCLLVEQQVRLKLDQLTPNPQSLVSTHPRLSRFRVLPRLALPRQSATVQNDIEMPIPEISPALKTTPNAPALQLNGNEREWLETLQKRIKEANGGPLSMFVLLFFLLVGVVASVGGYIGCFSVVQGVKGSGLKETSSWLSLEVFLSIVRIIVWGLNPTHDDAPPLKFKFKLDKYPPLATCTQDLSLIEEKKDLPLARAPEFLQSITSYAGLLKQFSDPRLTLYYTLTWKGRNKDKERVLFITIFDHIERTTRVYMENKASLGNVASSEKTTSSSCFYSADLINVDLEHGVLKTRLGCEIREKDDPIAMDDTLRMNLGKHYRSILEQVNRAVGSGPVDAVFKNDWTLKFGETLSQVNTEQSSGEAASEPVYEKRDNAYLQLGELEAKVQALIRGREKWVMEYMKWSSNDSHGKLNLLKESGALKVRHEWDLVEHDIGQMLVEERVQMERMLVDEVYGWEEKLRQKLEDINYSDEAEKETATQRWRAALWEWLGEGTQAMLARMASTRSTHKKPLDVTSINRLQEDIKESWQSIFIRLNVTKPKVKRFLPFISYLKTTGQWRGWIEGRRIEMERRLRSEKQGVEDRLGHGLEHCRFALPFAFKLIHSDSKWKSISSSEGMSLLKRNPHVIHITMYDNIDLSDVTQCTSIYCRGSRQPNIQLPPNILSISAFDNDLIPDEWQRVCEQNWQRLEAAKETTFVFTNMYGSDFVGHLQAARSGTFTVWFNGPSSGSLTLQVIHSSPNSQMADIMINGVHSPHSVPHTKIFEEILMHGGSVSDDNLGLVFRRNERNTLTFFFSEDYELHFIELVDDLGRPYRPDQRGKQWK